MNYFFNVLWFEDNAGWYRLQKPKLEAIVAEHCLQCNITPKRSSSFDVEELKTTNYDLILMDYDLASKITGVHVISAIRDANVLTDILFYSSQYDAMISAVASISPPLDGIYYSSRKIEEFHQKLSSVISKIVQRSEDLINLRGFVLDNTCDFELRIREVLTICWSKFTSEQKEHLSKKMVEQLDGKCGRVKAQVEKAKRQTCVYSYANNDDYMLSIADRLDILEVILPILISEYSICSTSLSHQTNGKMGHLFNPHQECLAGNAYAASKTADRKVLAMSQFISLGLADIQVAADIAHRQILILQNVVIHNTSAMMFIELGEWMFVF